MDRRQHYKVNKGLESPKRYLMMIFWETLEDHTVHFREGPLFPQWRAIVGPYFAEAPKVEHFSLLQCSQGSQSSSASRSEEPATKVCNSAAFFRHCGPLAGIQWGITLAEVGR